MLGDVGLDFLAAHDGCLGARCEVDRVERVSVTEIDALPLHGEADVVDAILSLEDCLGDPALGLPAENAAIPAVREKPTIRQDRDSTDVTVMNAGGDLAVGVFVEWGDGVADEPVDALAKSRDPTHPLTRELLE